MKKHALITGGAGFIGSHVADHLLERGFAVTLLDCLDSQVHGDEEHDSTGWPTYVNQQARKIKGNILEKGLFENSLVGVTHLVHLAASVGVGQSMTNIIDYTKNNTLAAAVILETLSKTKHKVERIAVASSMSIYGEGMYSSENGKMYAPPSRDYNEIQQKKWEIFHEGEMLTPIPTSEDKPLYPASIYAINKRDHEEMFLVVGKALSIPTIALRLFNTYGSRQALSNPYTGVIAIFICRLLNGLSPLIFEDGEQKRDFVHVSDVAKAFSLVLESDNKIWDVFNVGSGNFYTCREIADLLAKHLNKKIEPEILNTYRMGDIRHCFADIKKIKKNFGFEPKKNLYTGIDELIEWTKKQNKPLNKTTKSMQELKSRKLIL